MNRQTVVGKGSAEIKVYKGKSVFEGIAIGKIRLIKIKKRKFQGTLIVDPDSETLLKYVKKEEEERIKQELRNEDIPYHEMELGADLTLTDTFLDMVIDELSVSPSRILSIRKKVREHQ